MAKPLILSVGADGRFAGMVVPELVRRGARVRGLVHQAENADKARANGATEVAVADLHDRRSLEAALMGVERVFYLSPVFQHDEVELGRGFVEAAKAAGVRRIVFSSIIHPVLSALENHIVKGPVENAVLNSGLDYTFLHPAILFQNYTAVWPSVVETGTFAEPYSAEQPMSRVDYRDVAEAAAIALTEDRLLYGTFELCAEGNLDRHGVATLMGEVLGREIKPATLSFDDWVEKAKLPYNESQMAELRAMYTWYDAHSLLGNALTLRAVLGREPRTFRAFFEELAAKPVGEKQR